MQLYVYALHRVGEPKPAQYTKIAVDWNDMVEAENRANAKETTPELRNWNADWVKVTLAPELYAKLRGKLGGSSRSPAKQAASRANGLKGGKTREAPASPTPPGKPRAKP